MPLTDPELDLLRELLEDDPTEDVFLQVGEELNRRDRFNEAFIVLKQGLEAHPDELEGWAQLARSALEVGEYVAAIQAYDRCGNRLQKSEELGRVRVLALERSGDANGAKEAVEDYRKLHGSDDVVVESAWERLDAPPPDRTLSAADPFLTVGLAERYAALGRADRAIRVYHRILHRYPANIALRNRVAQLKNEEADVDDFTDLSEELIDPASVPPDLRMPEPGISSASVEPAPGRSHGPGRPAGLEAFMNSSREAQRRKGKTPVRRKRRSLLKR